MDVNSEYQSSRVVRGSGGCGQKLGEEKVLAAMIQHLKNVNALLVWVAAD
jgi:hypothetical protein